MLIKKMFCLPLALTILLGFNLKIYNFNVKAVNEPNLSAYSAVVLNSQTNEVVFQKEENDIRSMASTTKIMTAIIAIESGKMNDKVVITQQMTGAEGTSIGLKKDYEMTLETLVYGMLLESGNDSANAVAIFLAGSLEDFAVMMNEKAAKIGMSDTSFITASGLDDDQHYTTAYDMALLGSYAIKNEKFKEICSTETISCEYIEPKIKVTFSNHNSLLEDCEGCFGIKTGFTKKSGRCLVSAVERNGTILVAVTLNAGDDWNDHKKMYDYAFEKVESEVVEFEKQNEMSIQGASQQNVKTRLESEDFLFSYLDKTEDTIQTVYLPKFVYAPIEKGDVLGRIEVYYGDRKIASTNILADETVNSIEPTYVKKISLFERIKQKILSWLNFDK